MGLGDFNWYYQDDDDEDEAPDNVPNIPTTSHGRGKKGQRNIEGQTQQLENVATYTYHKVHVFENTWQYLTS